MLTALFLAAAVQASAPAYASVYFETGSDHVSPIGREIVAAFVRQTRASEKIVVEGHTSRAGDEVANVDLSRRRAHAVRQVLIEQGVAAERIATKAYGESRPAAFTPDGAAEALNERAVMRVVVD